ncbi:helix-turn-helix domain-containing protein [Streptomyces sp. NRRL B-24720]|uniref:helix-turn-helix domain-containing protein n=1 Tax=Streptomyces sp. NRRL B-24720 TaxID=1476876 RepID=UPI003B636940
MSVVEQRYHAVMEVAAGVPVTQVAARYGVSRQSLHSWVRKYEQSGLPGLADRSHRPGQNRMSKAPNHDRLGAFVLVGADGFEPPTSAL